MGENICKRCDQQGLNFQNKGTAHTAQQTTKLRNADINTSFSKEEIHMINSYMKRCSTSHIIREMQVKTTMRYHRIPVRMGMIKKFTNNKFWRGCKENGTFLSWWYEYKLVQLLWRTVWRFLKKLKMQLPYDILLLKWIL